MIQKIDASHASKRRAEKVPLTTMEATSRARTPLVSKALPRDRSRQVAGVGNNIARNIAWSRGSPGGTLLGKLLGPRGSWRGGLLGKLLGPRGPGGVDCSVNCSTPRATQRGRLLGQEAGGRATVPSTHFPVQRTTSHDGSQAYSAAKCPGVKSISWLDVLAHVELELARKGS